jgi:hypothetical protein
MGIIPVSSANAALGVRLAHEQMLQRRREAKVRLLRERRQNLSRVLGCCGMLTTLLALGLFTGWVPVPKPPVAASHEPSVDRPVDRFVETRTGQILISARDGIFCQRVLFNNETGLLSSDKIVPCDDPTSENSNRKSKMPDSRNPAEAFRGGFTKK